MPRQTDRPDQVIKREERINQGASGVARFPDKPQPHTMLMVFEKYDYSKFASAYQGKLTNPVNSALSQSTRGVGLGLRGSNSVELPFPKQLTDQMTMQFADMQQNPLIEGLALKMANSIGEGNSTLSDIPSQLQSMGAEIGAAMAGGGDVNSAIRSLGSAIASTGTADAANASMYLLRKYIPDAIGSSINLALGQTLNPRETLSFQGVELKTHTFNWDLYPSSARDSAKIQDIINILKQNTLPVTSDLGSGGMSIKQAFLEYPAVCKVFLVGVDNSYFMKFKPAMVKSVAIDYAAGGTMAIMKGGKPGGVNIQMTIQELQIETANDFGVVPPEPLQTTAQEEPPVPPTASAEDQFQRPPPRIVTPSTPPRRTTGNQQ